MNKMSEPVRIDFGMSTKDAWLRELKVLALVGGVMGLLSLIVSYLRGFHLTESELNVYEVSIFAGVYTACNLFIAIHPEFRTRLFVLGTSLHVIHGEKQVVPLKECVSFYVDDKGQFMVKRLNGLFLCCPRIRNKKNQLKFYDFLLKQGIEEVAHW